LKKTRWLSLLKTNFLKSSSPLWIQVIKYLQKHTSKSYLIYH